MSAHKHNLQEVIYIIPQKLGFIQPLVRITYLKISKTGGFYNEKERITSIIRAGITGKEI